MKEFDFLALGLCGQSVFLTVDHFHAPEETLHAEGFFTEPGGKAYNQAVAGARLGARVCFAGAVGRDDAATVCAARLNKEGVKRARWFPKEESDTAYACILTDSRGENRVTVYPGAAALLSEADVESLAGDIAASEILLLTCEIPERAFRAAVRIAKRAGVRVLVNPAPFRQWVGDCIADAWFVTPNRDEAKRLYGWTFEMPVPLSRAVLVTLGADGAALYQNGEALKIDAPRVAAVDTTGAGDAFNAAFAYYSARGECTERAAKGAVVAASASVQYQHVLDGYLFSPGEGDRLCPRA